MEKFGKTILDRKNDLFRNYLTTTNINPFYYLINWKDTRTRVNLMRWVSKQVKETSIADQIIIDNGWDKIDDHDKLILKILVWVYKNFKYIGDKEAWGTPEHWNTIEESFERYYIKKNNKWIYVGGEECLEQYPDAVRGMDCEDFMLMILTFARKCGIDYKNIKGVAGFVIGGGHAYVVYTNQYGEDYTIDGCYWFSSKSFRFRKVYWEDKNYYYGERMWFAFNDKQILMR